MCPGHLCLPIQHTVGNLGCFGLLAIRGNTIVNIHPHTSLFFFNCVQNLLYLFSMSRTGISGCYDFGFFLSVLYSPPAREAELLGPRILHVSFTLPGIYKILDSFCGMVKGVEPSLFVLQTWL